MYGTYYGTVLVKSEMIRLSSAVYQMIRCSKVLNSSNFTELHKKVGKSIDEIWKAYNSDPSRHEFVDITMKNNL